MATIAMVLLIVQAEASGKTCFGIGEAQPIDAERAGKGEYDILK